MSKKALCIGINDYPGTQNDLSGCVNDANDWAATLTARGFTVSKLIDAQATKAAMVAGIGGLVSGAAKGDTVVITEGPFAGLEAAYRMADAEQRVMVLLHILSQPVPVQIDAARLRKVS